MWTALRVPLPICSQAALHLYPRSLPSMVSFIDLPKVEHLVFILLPRALKNFAPQNGPLIYLLLLRWPAPEESST